MNTQRRLFPRVPSLSIGRHRQPAPSAPRKEPSGTASTSGQPCTRCHAQPGRHTILGTTSGPLAGSRVFWCRPCIIRSKIAHAEAVTATIPRLKHQLAEIEDQAQIAHAEAVSATLPALKRQLAEAEHDAASCSPP
jgi:hypothetical protein